MKRLISAGMIPNELRESILDKGRTEGFKQGFCYAVAQCIRLGNSYLAQDLWDESGFSKNDLSVCDEYDLEELKNLRMIA